MGEICAIHLFQDDFLGGIQGAPSDLGERPKEWLRGGLLHIEEHNLLLFTNAPVNDWGTHWYLVL